MQKKDQKFFFIYQIIAFVLRVANSQKSSTGYLSSAVNVLTNTPKASPNTRGDISQTKFHENVEKTCQKCSHGDLASIWDGFKCSLSMCVLKRHYLESGLTKIFTVIHFGNTLAMTIILFYKMFKIWYTLQKWNRKTRQSFSFCR